MDNTSVTNDADRIRDLYIERETLSDSVHKMRSRIREIDRTLMVLVRPRTYAIPRTGVVYDMAQVMSESDPMTLEEIMNAMSKKKLHPKRHTVRQYLSYIQCFEKVKENKHFGSNRSGWICHKDMLGLEKIESKG